MNGPEEAEEAAARAAYELWHAVRWPDGPEIPWDHFALGKARPAWLAVAKAESGRLAEAAGRLTAQLDEARALLEDQADNRAELSRLRRQLAVTTDTAHGWRDERDRLLSEVCHLTAVINRAELPEGK